MGRVTKSVSNGLTTTTIYDALGRKYTETEADGNGYAIFRGYFYEGISPYVREELTGQYHLLLYSSKEYEYDGEMRIVKVKESGKETVSYTYDANGNKKSEILANGVVSTYTYNKANRITKIENKSGNSTISSYEYSYYFDGSDACKVRNEGGIIETTSYEYDGLKRLTEESVKVGNKTSDTYSYEYDDYGNRSKMTATGTENYETVYDYSVNGKYTALLQKETKTVEDENALKLQDNVKQTFYTYDSNGNQVKKVADGKTETNTYDGLNQLIGFTDGETTASYKYNASGLRYEKTVDGQTINHVWDGSKQIIADVIDSQFYEADCYIRGTNLVAKYNFKNGDKSEYTYYIQNAHGDVVDLTDKDGKVIKKYTYDAFGVEKNIDKNDANAFRYCGEYFDAETGTIYLRARNYNPSTGRFISRDSYAGDNSLPLSLNLYTYCANNPVVYADPSGHIFGIDDLIICGIAVIGCAVLLTGCDSEPISQELPKNNPDKAETSSQVITPTGPQKPTNPPTNPTVKPKKEYNNLTNEQRQTQLIVAMTIYGEEHGRSISDGWQDGQKAIAATIINRNRAQISYLGTTLEEICTNGQYDGYFSGKDAYENGDYDSVAWDSAYQLAEYVVRDDFQKINAPLGITQKHLYFNANETYNDNISSHDGKFWFGEGTDPVTPLEVITCGGNTFFYYE